MHNGVHFVRRASPRACARDTSARRNALGSGPGDLGPPRGPWPHSLGRLRFSLARYSGPPEPKNSKNVYNGGFDVSVRNVKTPIIQMYPIMQICWFSAHSSSPVGRKVPVLWCFEQPRMWRVWLRLGSSSYDEHTLHTARPKLAGVAENAPKSCRNPTTVPDKVVGNSSNSV